MQNEIKISDFGLSIKADHKSLLKTHCGTVKYAAPEVRGCIGKYAGPPVDVWSCGVILYILVAGEFPFSEASAYSDEFNALMEGRFRFPKHFSEELRELLLLMWHPSQHTRISIAEVLSQCSMCAHCWKQIKKHTWMKG